MGNKKFESGVCFICENNVDMQEKNLNGRGFPLSTNIF